MTQLLFHFSLSPDGSRVYVSITVCDPRHIQIFPQIFSTGFSVDHLLSAMARHFGPVRRPDYYNLQNLHEDHDLVGRLIAASRNRWLDAEEVSLILRNDDSLTVSTPSPPKGVIGIFIYDTNAFYDHRMWQHLGGNGMGRRDRIRHNGCVVNLAESIRLLNDHRYIKRVYRNSRRFGQLALVHYRLV